MIKKSDAIVAFKGVYFNKNNEAIRIDSHTRGFKGEIQVFYFKDIQPTGTFWYKAEEETHHGKTSEPVVVGIVNYNQRVMIDRVIEIAKAAMNMEQAIAA